MLSVLTEQTQVKGEIMAIHAYFMAVLVGASLGGAEALPGRDQSLLIATNDILADVGQLCVVLATHETPQVEELLDVDTLKARIVDMLAEAGIKPVEGETGLSPRLVLHVEGMAILDCDKYVYRVQTSLNRLVTFTNRRDLQIQAEVWHVRPVMEIAAGAEAADAMAAAALTQVEVFLGAYKAARTLLDKMGPARHEAADPAGAGPRSLPALSKYPFVASRSSSVFHRPDCRWAQNIAESNLVGYQNRDEAVQAGKRPCKTCRP